MDVEEILQRALSLGEEDDWAGMAQELRSGLESFPGDPYILCWLGVAEEELGMEGVAYERFKQALSASPEDPHLLATAGSALARFDDPDAEATLRAAAMMAPELPLARWMYGAYLSREGFLDQALEELAAAVELAPEEPAVALELGVAMALKGEMETAIDAFSRATMLDPDDGWPRVLLGLTLCEVDRMEEAAGDLSAGAHLRPDDVEAQLLAALAACAVGWDDAAYEMVERARQVALGGDLPEVEEVAGRVEAGAAQSLEFLVTTMVPGTFRERLMIRP
jgi:tetratricopeptide (TPR) repeat protein